MKTCSICGEQQYDERANDGDRCMSCQANSALVEGAGSLDELPLHEVVEEGVNLVGQRYVRLRFADGSESLIDPVSWKEEVKDVQGRIARPDEQL